MQQPSIQASYKNGQKGFSLVELLVVICIIGILAIVAVPSYQNHIKDGRRTDAMNELQKIANRIEEQKLVMVKFSNISLNNVFGDSPDSSGEVKYPYSGTPLYTISLSASINAATPTKQNSTVGSGDWTLIATPIGDMTGDGDLTLDFKGEKCHDTKCGLGNQWRD